MSNFTYLEDLMSRKDRRHQHQENEEQHDEEQADREEHEHLIMPSKDLLEYDRKKSREMLERYNSLHQEDELSHPTPDDPQHGRGHVPPGQENVPRGHTTGRGMQGGSAKRRKR
jgi:hypothetical protein